MSASEAARKPPRPSIPPLAYALVAVIVTERICIGARLASLPLALALGALALVLMGASRMGKGRAGAGPLRVLSLVLVASFASVLLSLGMLSAERRFASDLSATSMGAWRFEVQSDSVRTRRAYRCRARATSDACQGGTVWLETDAELARGERLRVVGTFRPLEDGDWDRSSRMQGVWGAVSAKRVVRLGTVSGLAGTLIRLKAALLEAIGPEGSEERALLAGLLLGDRRALSAYGLDGLFSTCGVSHLVAVSGTHIAIVSSLLEALIRRARLGVRARGCVLLVGSGLFVAVCGAPPSAVRAWLMSLASLGAALVGRRSDALSALSVVGMAMALVNPAVSGQVGFLLSLVCVGGIVLFGGYARYALDALVPPLRLPRAASPELRIRLRNARRAMLGGVGATLVAQAASAPIAIPLFSLVSLVAPLANAVASAPFVSLLLLGLVSCLASLAGLPAALPLRCCDAIAAILLRALRALATIPLAAIPVEADPGPCWALLAVVSAALLCAWPTVRRAQVARMALVPAMLLFAALLRWRFFAPSRISVLDIGQGDAILVQDGGAAVLVDTGPGEAIGPALARNHVLHLDALVISHLHDDHYGGADELVGIVGVDRVLVARGAASHMPSELSQAARDLGCAVEEIGYGDRFSVGGFRVEVVSPVGIVTGEENCHSLELLVSFEGDGRSLTALLTGDAEQDMTSAAIGRGDVGDVDLLKVGHHGSAVSVDEGSAQALRAEVAVASAGQGNSYGHPAKECRDVLEDAGSTFLCTIDAGDVEVRPGSGGPSVRCQRGQGEMAGAAAADAR